MDMAEKWCAWTRNLWAGLFFGNLSTGSGVLASFVLLSIVMTTVTEKENKIREGDYLEFEEKVTASEELFPYEVLDEKKVKEILNIGKI